MLASIRVPFGAVALTVAIPERESNTDQSAYATSFKVNTSPSEGLRIVASGAVLSILTKTLSLLDRPAEFVAVH